MDARADGHSDDSERTTRWRRRRVHPAWQRRPARGRRAAQGRRGLPDRPPERSGPLANLALETKSKRKKKTPAKAKEGESSDDDVVSAVRGLLGVVDS